MSPSAMPHTATNGLFENDLDLSIVGIGVEYPSHRVGPEALEILAERHYSQCTA